MIFRLLLLSLLLTCSFVLAQKEEVKVDDKAAVDKSKDPGEKKPEEKIADPTNLQQAKELFGKAIEFQQKQKMDKAIECYAKLSIYYRAQPGDDAQRLCMYSLNNMGVLMAAKGDCQAAAQNFQEALQYALKLKLAKESAEFFYKLGFLYDYIANLDAKKHEKGRSVIRNGEEPTKPLEFGSTNSFSRLQRLATGEFQSQQVSFEGTKDPFNVSRNDYTKLVNLKVKGDFNPDALLVPDSLKFSVNIYKRGYFSVTRSRDMLPEMEYAELMETMIAIPRKVDAQITEDFYHEGTVTPDEITLSVVEGQTIGKPTAITEKEAFKPATYRLSIQKAGYENISESITIYPDEGSFELKRELQSKLRGLVTTIRGDFTAMGTDIVIPDEVSLNSQMVYLESKVKPAEYKLVIKKEGYEPVIKQVVIKPDERAYGIEEMMKSLPREVLVKVTGDYGAKDDPVMPDEVTFNGRFVKMVGESLHPDAYRVVIRKKGYEAIQKRVIIEPKNEPYILKEALVSLPRRIQPNIFGSFPANFRIFNPDSCTLNDKDVASAESFKPGTYVLFVKHRGYIPVTRTVEIEPDDKPYILSQILDPKDVQINLDITYDVPPQDPNTQYTVNMEREKDHSNTKIKSGDKLTPESYILKVEMPGYETETQREMIMPRDDPYTIVRRLISSPRRVITDITAEYPEGTVVPDEITLDNKAVSKDFKIKPGAHDLVILKEGYLPIRKSIKILASDKDYMLVEKMETKTRLVTFEFRDSFDRRKLTPDEALVGNDKLSSETVSLKPGDYSIRANLKGYAPLDETINVPVGSEPLTVVRLMIAIKRDVITEITGDFKVDERLVPDVFTLNDIPIADKAVVKPGPYNLTIQRKGYYPILEKVIIAPDPKPFLIKKCLQSKPRKLNVNIKSSFTNATIIPQMLMVGTENIKDGQQKKPAEYPLIIKEKGYQTISSSIVIEPSEDPYDLVQTLEALQRLVKYELVSDFDNKVTAPDVINLSDKTILEQKTAFLPGKYSVKIEKRGFQGKQFETVIEPDEEPYVVKGTLESLPREIEAIITGDFPKGDRIDPELVALGQKEARSESFKPGKYELNITNAGYFPLKKDVIIPPGEDRFLIEEELITKPRLFKEKIGYDVAPPDGLGPYKITIAPLDSPKNEKPIKEGEVIKPNSYILRILKEAYEPIEEKMHVWPQEAPFVLDKQMVAKQVVININITHDVPPPRDLEDYKVSLVAGGVLQFVTHGKRIKPGSYDLIIQRPGYTFGNIKKIDILPSESPYPINESLIAKPRNISFDMVDEATGTLVPAIEILEAKTGKAISFKDYFPAGSEVSLITKFKNYKTISKTIRIEPGEGPLVAKMTMKKLIICEFNVRQNEQVIDGITYPFSFYADNEEIEKHLVNMEKGVGRFYYKLFIEPEAKDLRVYAGYFFAQKPFSAVAATGIGVLESIGAAKLIEHLARVSQSDERGFKLSLDVMDNMLKRPTDVRKLKACHTSEIDQLIQYVESWKFTVPNDRVRQQDVTDRLGKLKQ